MRIEQWGVHMAGQYASEWQRKRTEHPAESSLTARRSVTVTTVTQGAEPAASGLLGNLGHFH